MYLSKVRVFISFSVVERLQSFDSLGIVSFVSNRYTFLYFKRGITASYNLSGNDHNWEWNKSANLGWVHVLSMNQNNWKSDAFCKPTRAAFEACAKRRSWAQTSKRYMGKYINWILWLKEKACLHVDKVYWKQGDHVEMCFFFLNW